MTIIFLPDEKAEEFQITDIPYMRLKGYPGSPDSVIVNEKIITKKRFLKMPGKVALELLGKEGI